MNEDALHFKHQKVRKKKMFLLVKETEYANDNESRLLCIFLEKFNIVNDCILLKCKWSFFLNDWMNG